MKANVMINVHAKNQIELSHYAFDKAWNDNPKRMALLLTIMNKDHYEERNDLEKLKIIEEEGITPATAKREYWGYFNQIKADEQKNHPRKYKTKWGEQTDG